MDERKVMSEETSLYITGWCLLGGLLLYVLIMRGAGRAVTGYLLPCMIHTLTGGYCPGCGGTRAVIYLLQRKLWKSFCYHPIVLYTAVIGGWFMISQSIQRLSRDKIRIGMHYRSSYLWIALAIVIVNCIVKNVALFAYGVDMLP